MPSYRQLQVRPGRRVEHGFTLVEVLIVLCIIGILCMVLLPVFGSVRESARRATCSSNLRQIHVAVQLYVTDHNGFYPYFAHYGEDCTWVDRVHSYIKSPEVFQCPSFIESRYGSGEYRPGCPALGPSDSEDRGYFNGSYSMNQLVDGNNGTHRARFTRPASTITFLDGKGEHGWLNGNARPIEGVERVLRMGVPNHHNGGDNVLFADGHVKWLRIEEMTDIKLWSISGSDVPTNR